MEKKFKFTAEEVDAALEKEAKESKSGFARLMNPKLSMDENMARVAAFRLK